MPHKDGDSDELKELDYNEADDEIANIKNPPVPTDESCFCFDEKTKSITQYYTPSGGSYCDFPINNTCGKNVVIPRTIKGVRVEHIGEGAFYSGFSIDIDSVVIPDTVLTIEDDAFDYQKIKEVKIPNSVIEIGKDAFAYSNLNKVIISDSVEKIGHNAFGYCQSGGITELKLGKNVREIGDSAFMQNSISSLAIPESVETIGVIAFGLNKLTELDLKNVKTVGSQAFTENKISSLVLGNKLTTIGFNAFVINKIKNLTIPENVETIGEAAFGSNDLRTVTINSKKITSIGNRTFEKDSGEPHPDPDVVGNYYLTTIYNNSGKSFDWNSIVTYSQSGTPFEFGTTTNDVTITKK